MSTTSLGPVTRFRHHPAKAVVGIITAISLTTLIAASPWFAPLLAIPVAYAVWAWRAGTDAGPDGLTVRALLGHRRLPWPAVAELTPTRRDRVVARLAGGGAVALTAVAPADLPRLVAASGGSMAAGGGGNMVAGGGGPTGSGGPTGGGNPVDTPAPERDAG